MNDPVTDDSILRAVAAAPSSPPPERLAPPDPAPRRGSVGRVAGLVVLVAALAGVGYLVHAACAPIGEPVPDWTLDADGGPRGVAVTLPGNLFDPLRFRDTTYTLHTELALSDDQRGPLALSFECFHASLALTVDGVPVADDGDTEVGEHRYAIDAQGRATIHLALAARHDYESSGGFGVAPHLSIGVAERSAVATLDRYATVVALVLCGLFTLLYGGLFALDRRHREYLATAVSALASFVPLLYMLGVLPTANATFAGRLEPAMLGLSTALMVLGVMYFVHLAFELGRPPRFWVWVWCSSAVTALATPFSLVPMIATLILGAVFLPAFFVYLIVRCVRAARRGDHRYDARIFLVWVSVQLVTSVIENLWRSTGVNRVGGLHPVTLSITLLMLAQTAVFARQFSARQRTIERTADELRRQVAERSKELAEALRKLARAPQVALVAGSTIDGRYRVLEKLGAGGMGTVYEVERLTDRRHLALKTLRGRVDAAVMARFAREAQIAAELQHPNLVPVIDVGIAEGGLYLVMELIEGGTLGQARARFGDASWARPILAQIATGLAVLHERGIVHRDLKPGNILLAGGVARIADFGLASLRAGPVVAGELDDTTPASPLLTRAEDVFGTPAYMAPELAAGVKDAPSSSDLFSFGIIAYELLSGHAPFAEPPMIARMNDRPIVAAPLTGFASGPLIERCLDLDPAKRPTAADVVAALRS